MARKGNREIWVEHVNNQNMSDLSQKVWCEKNNINYHNFAYWVGRFKKENAAIEPNGTEWVTVLPSKPCIDNNKNTGNVTISIGNAVIDFKTDTDIESFEKVIQILVKYV